MFAKVGDNKTNERDNEEEPEKENEEEEEEDITLSTALEMAESQNVLPKKRDS